MAFEFYEANCVIAGTFNIYIIRPEWLGKIGLLPEGSDLRVERQWDQPGFRFSSSKLGSRWTVLPHRLILETNNPTEDCGKTADEILKHLPWTPLIAVGCNFAYRGDASAVDGWEAKTSFPPKEIRDGEPIQRTWHVGVQRGDQVFNLQLSESADGVEVRANAHTEVRQREIDFARETARQFFQHRNVAIALMNDIFNVGIQDGITDK